MSRAESQTTRAVIEAQTRRLNSSDLRERVVESFFRCGELRKRLPRLTDRQIGQLVFDVVWDELGLMSPALSICIEAIERLFRSPAGARAEDEVLNDVYNLPVCPRCGDDMLHYVGIDEPDYRKCDALNCGHKMLEPERD